MKFNYQARTEDGDVRSGQVEASSKTAAVDLLQGRGLYVTFLEPEKAPFYAKRVALFEGVSRKDIVLFSRQLAIMFKSKVPLVESLQVLSSQADAPQFKECTIKLSEDVEGGTPLSKALSSFPDIFSSFYVAMVKSGEASGKLSEVLNYLADHLEREYNLASKTKGALIYPAFIVFVVILVMLLMIFFVIPHLTDVLQAGNQPLPTITKIVIKIADIFRNWIWLIVGLIGLFVFGLFQFRATENGRKTIDRLLLRVPGLNSLLKMIYITRFAENLSTLISGGLPIAQALETTADIMGSTAYREVVLETRDKVRRGEPVSSVLSRHPDLFSPVFVQMVVVGEKTGSVDTTLRNIVDFYQKEIDRTIDSFLSVLEPVLIVFLGVVVAGLMLSILMPLYRMLAI